MSGPVVVALDGSELAEQAVPVAAALAGGLGAELHLVHVHVATTARPIYVEGLPVIDQDLRPQRAEHERAYLAQARDRLAAGGSVSTLVLEGPVASALASHARDRGASLIVLTTHGRGGFERAWLGSVADELTRSSPVPLLLLRPETASAAGPFRRVLAPLDGSPLAESILEHAAGLLRIHPGAELVLLAVVPPVVSSGGWPTAAVGAVSDERAAKAAQDAARAYLEEVARRLGSDGLRIRTRVDVAANVAPAILAAAADESADLVALATHGRSGLGRIALGSVADKLVRGNRTPILLFHPPPTAPAA